MMKRLSRPPQLAGAFEPGDAQSGYYNDLRLKVAGFPVPGAALTAIQALTADRELANAVPVAQIGLGAWQLDSEEWWPVVEAAATWVARELDEGGRFTYLSPMPHTYRLEPPWYSAMTQGEAVSLLVRAAVTLGRPDLLDAAASAVGPLVDPSSGLVCATGAGPVLQEYPTTPPAHVLNGWIFGLWGLYDAGLALRSGAGAALAEQAAAAFDLGAAALAARLPLYDAGLGWSRYDLFPHRVVHAASPFYQRLHVEQLRAMSRLRPEHLAYTAFADRWQSALRHLVSRSYGVGRKVLFRLLVPRHDAR